MKKSNPLLSIPTTPTTYSGQWLTFNHMANHYRRLLNVKPTINTHSGKNWNQPQMNSAALTPSKSKKVPKKPQQPKKKSENKEIKRPKMASKMLDFEYQTLVDALGDEVGFTLTPESKAYQLIFGDSQIHNLSEALMSESEPDEPNVSHMDIEEKIRRYLNQIRENNNGAYSISPLSSPSTRYIPNSFKHLMSNAKARQEVQNAYHTRHSKCFLPGPDEYESPRLRKKSVSTKIVSNANSTKKRENRTSDLNNNTNKKIPMSLAAKTKQKSLSSLTKRPGKSEIQKYDGTRTNSRCASPASIGTVHGSEDLEMEFPVQLKAEKKVEKVKPKPKSRTLIQDMDNEIFDESELQWRKRLKNATDLANANTKLTSDRINSASHSHNKDSSKDSAYGFSSSDSRITTRESTPEKIKYRPLRGNTNNHKNGKYKSTLSTVASSINQDNSPSQSLQYSTMLPHYLQSFPRSPRANNHLDKDHKGNWKTDIRYLNFLTSITDDIVKRGIYTNKGLKKAFNAHIYKHPELEMEKMIYMLDRLRMDVGVPKDDSLDSMEFGYGAIKYSAGPFFYEPISEIEQREESNKGSTEHKVAVEKPSTSEVSIFEHFHRARNFSGDESSKQSSCNESVINGDNGEPGRLLKQTKKTFAPSRVRFSSCSSRSSNNSNNNNNTNLEENDIRKALIEAGLDRESTMDILNAMKIKSNPISEDDDDDLNGLLSTRPSRSVSKSNL